MLMTRISMAGAAGFFRVVDMLRTSIMEIR